MVLYCSSWLLRAPGDVPGDWARSFRVSRLLLEVGGRGCLLRMEFLRASLVVPLGPGVVCFIWESASSISSSVQEACVSGIWSDSVDMFRSDISVLS